MKKNLVENFSLLLSFEVDRVLKRCKAKQVNIKNHNSFNKILCIEKFFSTFQILGRSEAKSRSIIILLRGVQFGYFHRVHCPIAIMAPQPFFYRSGGLASRDGVAKDVDVCVRDTLYINSRWPSDHLLFTKSNSPKAW